MGGGLKKCFFWPFRPQFGPKITLRPGAPVPGPLPWIRYQWLLNCQPNLKIVSRSYHVSNNTKQWKKTRLQNSPYFCVFKYARAVKQKVWNEAENRERDWGETLKIRNCRVSFIDLYLVFSRNFRIAFLHHTNTVILLERYCCTITEPGLPVIGLSRLSSATFVVWSKFLRF